MAVRKVGQQNSDTLFQSTWSEIVDALDNVYAVLLGEATSVKRENVQSKMQWYQKIYNASTQDQLVADKLYHELRKWLAEMLEKRVAKPVIAKCKESDGDKLFHLVTKYYSCYKIFATFGKVVFNYLGTYVTKRSGNDTLEMMFMKAFNQAVYNNVKADLRTVILRQVNSRRDGNQVDLKALKDAVGIFVNVGTATQTDEKGKLEVYSSDFEKAYLDSLRAVYRHCTTAELTREGGHFTYLKWVESRQELELFLAQELLRTTSYDSVRTATEEEMIAPHFEVIIKHADSGCGVLLEDWKVPDLARMYRLMKRVKDQKALKLMGEELQKRVEVEGAALMQDFNSTTSDGLLSLERPLVSAVTELNKKYGDLIKNNFEGSALFYAYRKAGFQSFLKAKLTRHDPKPSAGESAVEEKETSFSEVLATYLDAVMKRELKDVVDPDAELERLDDLLQVFTYITEKDVFQEFYKARLAKRLLQTTPNEELEKAFLERLQREMAKSYTHKMEGMLLDLDSTKQYAKKFATDASSAGLGCEFEVQVLTEANWPSYKSDSLVPPPSLRRCLDCFTRFYKKTNQTRKLTWINILGQATLVVAFPKGAKEVQVSLYQASVLVTVDEFGAASVKDLASALGIEPKGVKPHIASMYMHKVFSMLTRVDEKGEKLPVGKSIADDDRFMINTDFMHKTRKFKVPIASTAASINAGMPTDSELDGRRKIQVDAAIVRIMKSRKTMAYTELQDLVITQLTKLFVPQPKLIKQRVEDLVTREYLRRHEDDPKMFDYLA
jgi:hypothetical protein